MGNLPVSIAVLYNKLKRTEPVVLQGLVQGSAQRLAPVAAQFDRWRLHIVDGKHLPGSEKRLQTLRSYREAALP